jgi:cell wall-associated NlpC family hydrolase
VLTTERLLLPGSLVAVVAGVTLLAVAAAAATNSSPVAATVAYSETSAATGGRMAATTIVTTTTTVTPATTTTVPPPPPPPPTEQPPPPPTEPPPPTAAERVVAYARAQLGRPYRRGADGPNAFDCSGLTRAAYRAIGVDLPGYSVTQASMGRAVDWRNEEIRPGDLVFVRGDTPVIDLGHVGLAISSTEWIVAPRTGQVVQIAPIPVRRIQRVRRMVDG